MLNIGGWKKNKDIQDMESKYQRNKAFCIGKRLQEKGSSLIMLIQIRIWWEKQNDDSPLASSTTGMNSMPVLEEVFGGYWREWKDNMSMNSLPLYTVPTT